MPTSISPKPSSALVVDDDALIRRDALAILEDGGFETLVAVHADAAAGLLHDRQPHLCPLFTDVLSEAKRPFRRD